MWKIPSWTTLRRESVCFDFKGLIQINLSLCSPITCTLHMWVWNKEILCLLIFVVYIYGITWQEKKLYHRCHGMTATVGNYTIGYGDLYTNAYSIEAMEVSYVKISVIVFLMYICLLFLLFFFTIADMRFAFQWRVINFTLPYAAW